MARRLAQLAAVPATEIEGIGAKREAELAQLGIATVLDLITFYPRRYVDRTNQRAIDELIPGADAVVVATVRKVTTRQTRQRRAMVETEVGDGSGTLRITFFNQGWRATQLKEGTTAAFSGKVDLYRGRKTMTNPVVDVIGDRTGRIVPIYPQSEKVRINSWDLDRWVKRALERAGEFVDPVPDAWRDRLGLVDRTWAFGQIHGPDSMGAKEAARKRLAFDELFRLQVALVLRKRAVERESKGIRHVVAGPLVDGFHTALPFPLTGAQLRAIAEIGRDLAGPHPMHRLLQGDVGSGKTVVAATALLMGIQGGHQGALMAPTEVLAEQHFYGLRELLSGMTIREEGSLLGQRPLSVELLTNRTTAAERVRLHDGLRSGRVDLLIGTHALLTEGVEFAHLGVIVIDEQHRFGVEQRAALRGKGDDPDVLVMTATPIPRTAAMTVYGDLDVTILDEMPPGRHPVRTVWAKGPLDEEEAWAIVRSEAAAGHQAYVVCPLVEESERIEAKSAEQELERLQAEVLPDLRLGLLHGRMASKEKEAVMAEFRDGAIDVLVATTVIEVGVDVPNATVMVVESADRFGIASLHQLRGRVGRGSDLSCCFLLSEGGTEDAEQRLTALARTHDGFELAEVDLGLRGEGTILGVRQKGRTDLKLASLKRDLDLVIAAREVAFDVVDADPLLQHNPALADEIRAVLDPEEAEDSPLDFLFKS